LFADVRRIQEQTQSSKLRTSPSENVYIVTIHLALDFIAPFGLFAINHYNTASGTLCVAKGDSVFKLDNNQRIAVLLVRNQNCFYHYQRGFMVSKVSLEEKLVRPKRRFWQKSSFVSYSSNVAGQLRAFSDLKMEVEMSHVDSLPGVKIGCILTIEYEGIIKFLI